MRHADHLRAVHILTAASMVGMGLSRSKKQPTPKGQDDLGLLGLRQNVSTSSSRFSYGKVPKDCEGSCESNEIYCVW